MERVKINYRFVRLPKLENGCFLRVWCQSHVIGNMCPNHPDCFGIACPLFYQRDTTLFFLYIPPSFWSVDCLLVSLTFSLFLPASVLTALSLYLSTCSLYLLSLLPTHFSTEKSLRSALTHPLIFQGKLLTVQVDHTRDSQGGFKFNPAVMFCSQLHV